MKWERLKVTGWVLVDKYGQIVDEIECFLYDGTYRIVRTGARYVSLDAAKSAVERIRGLRKGNE